MVLPLSVAQSAQLHPDKVISSSLTPLAETPFSDLAPTAAPDGGGGEDVSPTPPAAAPSVNAVDPTPPSVNPPLDNPDTPE